MPARTDLNKPAAQQGQPDAPTGFDAAEKAMWKAIVSSRPATTWTPSDTMLLKQYVLAASDVERLTREIDRGGDVIAGKVNPYVKVRAMRELFLINLGMKLKLMPSNRWDPKTVHRLAQHATKGREALATIDSDDLLGGVPMRKGPLQ